MSDIINQAEAVLDQLIKKRDECKNELIRLEFQKSQLEEQLKTTFQKIEQDFGVSDLDSL